jgi:hypothetical protein
MKAKRTKLLDHNRHSVGRGYGEPALKDMARVIERFPRYLSAKCQNETNGTAAIDRGL